MSGAIQALIGSLAAVAKDPNWASVTLLLPGNGTNGAQNNTFLDASTNNFTITRNGNTTQGTFNPFTTTAPYSASINGGSGYFDGTGDYLTVANNTALQMGSGDFTIEFWLNYASITGFQTPFDKGYTGTGALLLQTGNGNGRLIVYASGSAVITETGTASTGAWIHYALVRSGTTLTLYRDGTSSGSATNSTNFNSTNQVGIGAAGTAPGGGAIGDYPIRGYMSNLRVVKGTAVYTANFTPPTSPVTAITNTSLLLNFTNAGIIDNAMMNNLETVGNAQISTAQSKFGGSSMLFDGTGDWFVSPNATSQQLDTGNFTIEGWLRLSATGVAYGVVSKGTGTTGWSVNVTSGNKLQFSYTATQLTGATSIAANTWYHFAVVRNGSAAGNLVIYLDGVADATSAGAVNDNFNQTSVQYVGASRTGTDSLNGYIDDLRITKGVARYTANFTPPAAAFPTS